MKTCNVDSCDRKQYAKSYCTKHYQMFNKYGDPVQKYFEFHNMSNTPEYRTWQHMKQRCYDKNYTKYADWGGRGIRVSKEWKNSFVTFYKDMGQKPSPLYTLERINNDGNYTADNCKWATRSEQLLNQRLSQRNTSGYAGIFWDSASEKWRAVITFKGKTKYLGSFDDKRDAIKVRKQAREQIIEGAQSALERKRG